MFAGFFTMKPEHQRIKIAEACGWTGIHHDAGYPWAGIPTEYPGENHDLPDYLNDLNAMAEAEKILTPEQFADYYWTVRQIVAPGWTMSATAEQRAEAFLRILNLWEKDTEQNKQ
jgi:hypothetical protein